uniref:50S ribosomal protein L16 n=1 Tax=Nephromyces sp. ex Molgula occidentalis TaxID=2544991 RepID=A0A5C1H884_9APIC|nr:50S ribosomal protein L16 [Nephromyces sp. ex Molgula occidentalis]
MIKTIINYLHFKKRKSNSKKLKLVFGNWAFKVNSNYIIENKHITLIKVSFSKYFKTLTNLYIRINLNQIKTFKPNDSRMGSGKGKIHTKVSIVKKNQILFEIKTNSKELAFKFFKYISYKLPIKGFIIYKNEILS